MRAWQERVRRTPIQLGEGFSDFCVALPLPSRLSPNGQSPTGNVRTMVQCQARAVRRSESSGGE